MSNSRHIPYKTIYTGISPCFFKQKRKWLMGIVMSLDLRDLFIKMTTKQSNITAMVSLACPQRERYSQHWMHPIKDKPMYKNKI